MPIKKVRQISSNAARPFWRNHATPCADSEIHTATRPLCTAQCTSATVSCANKACSIWCSAMRLSPSLMTVSYTHLRAHET
ncbi:hypothetical protein QG053_11940, partial [Kingella kingae]|nr:hypothetical protein [Kingella kingae]